MYEALELGRTRIRIRLGLLPWSRYDDERVETRMTKIEMERTLKDCMNRGNGKINININIFEYGIQRQSHCQNTKTRGQESGLKVSFSFVYGAGDGA